MLGTADLQHQGHRTSDNIDLASTPMGPDTTRTMLRNMLLGAWAAERMGLTGAEAEAYATALAALAGDPARSDVFSKVRMDFDARGVAQSDDEILAKITELTLKAGNQLQTSRAGVADGAAVALARTLMDR